jgi:hypothetical protein
MIQMNRLTLMQMEQEENSILDQKWKHQRISDDNFGEMIFQQES